MTLNASVSNYSSNVSYVWYVHGDSVATGPSYGLADTWAQGYCRIDVTAFRLLASYAFLNRATLVQVTIPSSVITVDAGAFYGCSALAAVNIQNGVQHLKDRSFFLCSSLVSVLIPASVQEVAAYSFVLSTSLQSIDVDPGNTFLSSEDGVLFNKDKTLVLQYPMGKPGADYAIPSGVQIIADGAFCRLKRAELGRLQREDCRAVKQASSRIVCCRPGVRLSRYEAGKTRVQT